jgi:hypothetical protein
MSESDEVLAKDSRSRYDVFTGGIPLVPGRLRQPMCQRHLEPRTRVGKSRKPSSEDNSARQTGRPAPAGQIPG